MPKTTPIEYSRTPWRRPIAISLLILLAFAALLATGCRGGQAPEMAAKASLAMAGNACEEGLMVLRAWECLSGGLRHEGGAAGKVRP